MTPDKVMDWLFVAFTALMLVAACVCFYKALFSRE